MLRNPLVNGNLLLLILDRPYDYNQLSTAIIIVALAIITAVLSSLRQFWQPRAL